ncbi:L-seryl-tRNA(Sec) selenium transferase [Virgibacillus byunsanensis]|uniref:L-seryl-tRNA(Sec) selenium transferase n=1 Tax=Virgibacillus byunsanensis TaxID=570945 RepID=A0ABW3LLK7_9BACI
MEGQKINQYLRQLPPVHQLQNDDRFKTILKDYQLTSDQLTKFIQQEVSGLRKNVRSERLTSFSCQDVEEVIFENAKKKVVEWKEDRLKQVINGTGTILHTNLGRSRLSEQAVDHVANIARNYSNLEYQVAEGERGSRHNIIEDLLKEATGAEAAMVVNNNAAAVFLILSALAKDQEVIVSRGQLVEIGGSFRISSIMEESGAHLVEVGTTNKTHLFDYENAVRENTAMIMKVHTSNFKTIGFTETVTTDALVKIKNKQENFIFYEDLGSGSLYDFKKHGIGDEPIVKEVIESGVDIVSFSGDKLLGGPQAGVIVGKKGIINQLKKHQLARVLRVDKMTLAALEQTLKIYLSDKDALSNLPTIRDVTRSLEGIKQQAEDFISDIYSKTSSYRIKLQEGISQIGGGTMPGVELPTYVATIMHESFPAQELAAKLRACTPVIVTRIHDNRVCVDFRTIDTKEMSSLVKGFLEMEQY